MAPEKPMPIEVPAAWLETPLDAHIEDLGLGRLTQYALFNVGVYYVRSLFDLDLDRFAEHRGVGAGTVSIVENLIRVLRARTSGDTSAFVAEVPAPPP